MILKKLITRTTNNPSEGALCVAEAQSLEVPFEVKRVYYTYGVKQGVVRGSHAHKDLEQILICVYGKIEVTLDSGSHKESVILDDPSVGLYIGPSEWRTMKWMKDDSVLLVLASEHYSEKDYIRNYDDFTKWSKGGQNNENTI